MLARRLQDGLDFIGVDPVGPVVQRLRTQLPHGRFEALGAHEVPAELYRGRVVLINSVIQYFPHESYLLAFLRAARDAGAIGIFVGDVRCAELLRYQRVAFKQTRACHKKAAFSSMPLPSPVDLPQSSVLTCMCASVHACACVHVCA